MGGEDLYLKIVKLSGEYKTPSGNLMEKLSYRCHPAAAFLFLDDQCHCAPGQV
jgi:hypothetical protein